MSVYTIALKCGPMTQAVKLRGKEGTGDYLALSSMYALWNVYGDAMAADEADEGLEKGIWANFDRPVHDWISSMYFLDCSRGQNESVRCQQLQSVIIFVNRSQNTKMRRENESPDPTR